MLARLPATIQASESIHSLSLLGVTAPYVGWKSLSVS